MLLLSGNNFRPVRLMGWQLLWILAVSSFPSHRRRSGGCWAFQLIAVPKVSPRYNRDHYSVRSRWFRTRNQMIRDDPDDIDWLEVDDNDKEEEDKEDDDDDNNDASSFLEHPVLDDAAGWLPEVPLSLADVQSLTVPQLKQQLRLRGWKISGRKSDLMQRLIQASGGGIVHVNDDSETEENANNVEQIPKERPNKDEKVDTVEDVSAYLDPEDVGKDIKSTPIGGSQTSPSINDGSDNDNDSNNNNDDEPEVWGAEARIVDDYEGRRLVVDALSETIIEFTGSNQSSVSAYVVATRDALQPFLAGGSSRSRNRTAPVATQAEDRVRQMQEQREQANRRPVQFEHDEVGLDEGDETGIFRNILHRDDSDWGKYTVTGAHVSAAEVRGVLLLSDVYGAFTDDTRTLAETIAFECQPAVVMVPDLFRGQPWATTTTGHSSAGVTTNELGQNYEEWRAMHSDLRVSVDVRAAAACLRERYGVSSVVVWGTCFGGGRALEAAAGWLPENGNVHDVDGRVGPPPVDPMAAVAWYPTRYEASKLFGRQHKGSKLDAKGNPRQMAIMAVFAEKDTLPGASRDEAAQLKLLLEQDERVKDHIVKVFKDQDHGFAHIGISKQPESDYFERFVDEEFGGAGRVTMGHGDAEVALLLSTAFMETYSRVFLPTIGPPISLDENEVDWSQRLEMNDLSAFDSRDVREEIRNSLDNFVEEPLGGYRIDPTDKFQEDELAKLLRSMEDPKQKEGPFAIQPDDDLPAIYAKLTAFDENFQIF